MGKKSSQRSRRGGRHGPPNLPAQQLSQRPQLKHRRFARRLAAAVVVPLLLLGMIEVVLRLVGYGYATSFFVPADAATFTTNPKFAWQYYPRRTATSPTPVLFAKHKAPGTKRVFILGESAAAGTPDPAFGFGRMVELMLHEQFPSNRFEVINAAMRGIDSHIIRTIASECAGLSPDLFLVYAGNNDMIGLHAPSPDEFTLTSNIHWLRFKEALNRLRLMQLGGSLLASAVKREGPKQDQEFFRHQRLAFDDPRREAVYRNYEINLRDICRSAEQVGAQTLLCSVAVNLRDFPPLASLHRKNLSAGQLAEWEKLCAEGAAAESAGTHAAALDKFEAAARIDDHFAELQFRLARCHDALGHLTDAQQHYRLARDWDAIQFRTDSQMNSIVHSVASTASRVRLLDVEERFAHSSLSENGLPGRRVFQEHVHFTFDGDYLMATLLTPTVAQMLDLPSPAKPLLSRDDCAHALAYTAIDDFNVKSSILRMMGNPPFLDQLDHATQQLRMDHELKELGKRFSQADTDAALTTYRAAIAARPDDWMLKFNYGNLLLQMNQPAAAARSFAEVVQRLPQQEKFRVALGNALIQAGRPQEAQQHFEAALKYDSELKAAQEGLRLVKSSR
jgi:tetratricopeptide (TPR) repeat protein